MTHERILSTPGKRDPRNPREIIEEHIAGYRKRWESHVAMTALREARDAILETRLTTYRGAP